MLSAQAKPAVERDLIPQVFTPREDPDQPSADSHTACQMYLDWRKDEGETGPSITKTAFTQKLNEKCGPSSRRGKKNQRGNKRSVNAYFWDQLTRFETEHSSLSHFNQGFSIDPSLRNAFQSAPIDVPPKTEKLRTSGGQNNPSIPDQDFCCRSISHSQITEQTSFSLANSGPDEPDPNQGCPGCHQRELPMDADLLGNTCDECLYKGNLDEGCPCPGLHPRPHPAASERNGNALSGCVRITWSRRSAKIR